MKNIRVFFLSKNFQILEVKFSIYLNRHVFVMTSGELYKFNFYFFAAISTPPWPIYKPEASGLVDKTEQIYGGVKMQFGHVYVFGAVAENTTDEKAWDIIKIYGSINTKIYRIENIICCLMYKFEGSTDIIETDIISRVRHRSDCKVRTCHFTCRNIWHKHRNIPDGVGLSLRSLSCNTDAIDFKEISRPLKEVEPKVALTTQVAFASLSAELIIEWLETYKYLGVDKVISYYYQDLNANALKVLQYYHRIGFVELYRYEPAAEGKSYRRNV